MRTMLILVLLCSLAQIAAQGPALFLPEGCGTIFRCLAPASCKQPAAPLSQERVIAVDNSNQIYDDCGALIKFHSYGSYWLHVEIESFTTAQSIEFIHTNLLSGAEKNKFTCIKNPSGALQATFVNPKKTETVDYNDVPQKIKCIFQAKLGKNDQIFKYEPSDGLQFKIDTVETKLQDQFNPSPLLATPSCDPSKWEYHLDDTEKTKVYKEVQYSPGKYYCEDPIFKIEYRGADNKYNKVTLECVFTAFKVGTDTKTPKEYLDIRCAADAKFFCDYDVKVGAGKKPADRTKPVPAAGIASELKCPPTHRHLFVDGKPILKKEIKCLNYGGETSWTVGEIVLGKKGPEVHCEKIIQCELLRKITEKSVRKGKVGIDFLPECQREDGTLFVEKQKVTDKRCDESTGEFKYTIGGEEKVVDDSTIFECEYPAPGPSVADIKNENNSRTFKTGAVIGGVVAATIVAATIFIMSMYARNKLKKERMAAEAIDKAAFLRFGIRAPPKAEKPAELQEVNIVWNKLMMSFRYIASLALGEVTAARDLTEENEKKMVGQTSKDAANVQRKYVPKDALPATWPATHIKFFNGEPARDYDKFYPTKGVNEKKPDNDKNSEKKQ